ncbi:hypothetical protein BCR43DRAFT_497199 [Syncephalastrum racemosum]|uniref:Uncharacterized protein n=1 Tax=Syncephalastrum racemosum TaxID=13706 RepID=A0A1X2H5B6_SYNRA|nr:hypothetical protein BCR43DRAFT_497199 [Syncephalastrum racemosum]
MPIAEIVWAILLLWAYRFYKRSSLGQKQPLSNRSGSPPASDLTPIENAIQKNKRALDRLQERLARMAVPSSQQQQQQLPVPMTPSSASPLPGRRSPDREMLERVRRAEAAKDEALLRAKKMEQELQERVAENASLAEQLGMEQKRKAQLDLLVRENGQELTRVTHELLEYQQKVEDLEKRLEEVQAEAEFASVAAATATASAEQHRLYQLSQHDPRLRSDSPLHRTSTPRPSSGYGSRYHSPSSQMESERVTEMYRRLFAEKDLLLQEHMHEIEELRHMNEFLRRQVQRYSASSCTYTAHFLILLAKFVCKQERNRPRR